jgi:sugar phosphate isomerase/epimerase
MHVALAPLTVGRPEPATLVDAAAAAGFDQVGLTLWAPGGTRSRLCEDALLRRSLREQLDRSGVRVLDVGVVVLSPSIDLTQVGRLLRSGRELGADRVIAMNQDPDQGRAAAALAAVCELAGDLGMRVGIEFMPYTDTRTLVDAVALVESSGSPEAGVILDLLHLHRSGSVPQVADLDPDLVLLVQLCDARRAAPAEHRLRTEALGDRLYPGEGELPVLEVLSLLPRDVALTVEAPVAADVALSPEQRARRAAGSLRELFGRARTGSAPTRSTP